jgi:hypothetical protein
MWNESISSNKINQEKSVKLRVKFGKQQISNEIIKNGRIHKCLT